MQIEKFIVRDSSGNIDHEASASKFSSELFKFAAEQESLASTIGVAVHAYFDKHLGKRVNTDMAVGEILIALNVQPENYSILKDRVTDWIRNSPEFSTVRGRGGGTGRNCDLPSK